jgi:hypothetical protein
MTQGVAIPSIKRPKGNFGGMRVMCGDTEVVPVHPFKLEHRLSDKEMLVEGLYAFDPGALAPSCATVTLQVFSEQEPRAPDTLVVDAKVIGQIWQDFAPIRSSGRGLGTLWPGPALLNSHLMRRLENLRQLFPIARVVQPHAKPAVHPDVWRHEKPAGRRAHHALLTSGRREQPDRMTAAAMMG